MGVNLGFNEDRGEASEEGWPVSGIRVQPGSSKGQLESPSCKKVQTESRKSSERNCTLIRFCPDSAYIVGSDVVAAAAAASAGLED